MEVKKSIDMPKTFIFKNCFLIDCTGAEPKEGAAVVVEGEHIQDVVFDEEVSVPAKAQVLDLHGKTLMPGLTDAHVHCCAVDTNILEQHRNYPPALLVCMAAHILEQMLMQGYTTVRDASGADWGFKMAVEQGYIKGPRLLVSGNALSQTGGHADKRRRTETTSPYICCVGMCGMICDGVDEVRKASREQLRRGVDQIKIMAGGGAMSPTDPIDSTQYTVEEIKAAVYEAQAVGTYVLAHVYSAQGIKNCMEAGVRSIEHGNFLDEAGAQLIREKEAFLVPTMITYEMLATQGAQYGIPESNLDKIRLARDRSFEALKIAYQAGVKIGTGSDLLGAQQVYKTKELELRTNVLSPMEALLSATKVNAELFNMSRQIGSIEVGKFADLLVLDGNPLEDITLFQRPEQHLTFIMKGGEVFKNTLQ